MSHTGGGETTSTDYVKDFDAKAYLEQRFTAEALRENRGVQPLKLQIQCYHDFYSRFRARAQQHDGSESAGGPRALEFGSGPVIYPGIVAAPYVREFVFADYCEPCRREIHKWKVSDPAAHDWSPFFKYVESEVLGSVDGLRLEDGLRKRMTVIPCDLTKNEPVDAKWGTFDVISTSYCLECVCKSKFEFQSAISKLAGLLKPGGFLAIMICMEATFYRVEKDDSSVDVQPELFQLYLTTADVCSCFEQTGFSVVGKPLSFQSNPNTGHLTDCKKREFFVAQKVNA